jgi:hypothetical protein
LTASPAGFASIEDINALSQALFAYDAIVLT